MNYSFHPAFYHLFITLTNILALGHNTGMCVFLQKMQTAPYYVNKDIQVFAK